MTRFVNTDTNFIKASYLASYRIAKDGKHHTIGDPFTTGRCGYGPICVKGKGSPRN